MCQVSPGPRCSRHAQRQLARSQNKLANLRAAHAKITAAIDEAVNDTSYLSDEEVDALRTRQQEIQEQIEDQVDQVSADRDAYWTTPRGREELQEQIEKHRSSNNLRAVHTLTARLERAEQEYEQQVLAGKVAQKERARLESTLGSDDYHKYKSSTMEMRKNLRREEITAAHHLTTYKERLRAHKGRAEERQWLQQQISQTAVRVREAQEARRRFEEADYSRRAGIDGFRKVSYSRNPGSLTDGKHYLRLGSTDFGTARDYFPTGALVKITESRKDEVGNTVVKLETGHERLIYSDTVLVQSQ